MKNYLSIKIVSISLLISMMLLQGCNKQEVIDVRQTEVIQGLLYKLYEKEPFTGKVTNMSGAYFINMLKHSFPISISTVHVAYSNNLLANRSQVSCEVDFEQGQINGMATCIRNGEMVYQGHFNNGVKDGEEQFLYTTDFIYHPYDGRNQETRLKRPVLAIYNTYWEKGVKNGKEVLSYYPSNQLISSVIWKEGKKDGQERVSVKDESVSITIDIKWAEGRPINGYEKYTSSYSEAEVTIKNSQVTGIYKYYIFDPYDNQKSLFSITRSDFSNNVVIKEYFDYDNQLTSKDTYKNNQLINRQKYTKNTSTANNEKEQIIENSLSVYNKDKQSIMACVNKMVGDIREEIGEEEIITAYQLEEIESICQEKYPK